MFDVIPIYKSEGITPPELINHFRRKFPHYSQEKISVAGRLDPMASGLLILLVGEANKKRDYYQRLDKSYKFTLLTGVATDTYDILGKITSITKNPITISSEKVKSIIPKFVGTSDQAYPPYSSMHVGGKPLFYWARRQELNGISIPTKTVTIQSLNYVSSLKISKKELITEIENRIKKVNGNFRQNEIDKSWKENQSLLPNNLLLFSFNAQVSSGTYIRSLCNKLGQELGCMGLAYKIERTSCGDFNLNNAISLDE